MYQSISSCSYTACSCLKFVDPGASTIPLLGLNLTSQFYFFTPYLKLKIHFLPPLSRLCIQRDYTHDVLGWQLAQRLPNSIFQYGLAVMGHLKYMAITFDIGLSLTELRTVGPCLRYALS